MGSNSNSNGFRCESGGRFVTTFRSVTGESGFYDVVIGETHTIDGHRFDRNTRVVERLAVTEAAAYVFTELGVPHATTLDSLSGMIERALS